MYSVGTPAEKPDDTQKEVMERDTACVFVYQCLCNHSKKGEE